MRILKLQAENVKRLRAVQIEPDGNLVVIAGRNGQGKTSVLDAIWLALDYGAAKKGMARPIRDGENTAGVMLNFGDLVVTRTWTGEKSSLTVTSPDGAKYPSPQAMLDKLIGDLSFDPLAFTHQSDRDQLETLLDLVELPFNPAELDRRRATIFDARTDIGRKVREVEALVNAAGPVDEAAPVGFVDTVALLADHRAAVALNAARDRAGRELDDATQRTNTLRDKREELRRQLQELEGGILHAVGLESDLRVKFDDLAEVDVDRIEQQLADADDTNNAVRANKSRLELAARFDEHREAYRTATANLDLIDDEKRRGLADAKFPVDGLGFDDAGVTYGGIPFRQCSAAEQLRVSIAMAMALNPQMRVIRITDGSLLDSTNLALIEQMAAEHDYQVWIERVDETGELGIVIEDGAVVR